MMVYIVIERIPYDYDEMIGVFHKKADAKHLMESKKNEKNGWQYFINEWPVQF